MDFMEWVRTITVFAALGTSLFNMKELKNWRITYQHLSRRVSLLETPRPSRIITPIQISKEEKKSD